MGILDEVESIVYEKNDLEQENDKNEDDRKPKQEL